MRPALRAGTFAATMLIGGCASPGPSAAPAVSPTREQVPPAACPAGLKPADADRTTPDGLRAAASRRAEYGLPADRATLMAAACDPEANVDFGMPLTAKELGAFLARGRETSSIMTVVDGYTFRHPDEFGGVDVDQARGGIVVVSWTARVAEHAAALREKLPPNANVEFRQVQWTEQELWLLQQRIIHDDEAWYRAIPARVEQVSVDVAANAVVAYISSAVRDAPARMLDRYDVEATKLIVRSDGTGVAFLPSGTVRGLVTWDGGDDIEPWSLLLQEGLGGDPGGCGGGDVGYRVGEDGGFEYPCHMGTRVIEVVRLRPDRDANAVVGRASVEVPAGGEVFVEIEIDSSPPP